MLNEIKNSIKTYVIMEFVRKFMRLSRSFSINLLRICRASFMGFA